MRMLDWIESNAKEWRNLAWMYAGLVCYGASALGVLVLGIRAPQTASAAFVLLAARVVVATALVASVTLGIVCVVRARYWRSLLAPDEQTVIANLTSHDTAEEP
jgi:hypothetical protein